jgi:hypothetical protein
MLVSWVLMGRVYPVTESPNGSPTLLGQPCKEGYDSHYVVVKALGGPNSKVYFPCKNNQQPDYDEVVVFSKTQILPRYLIYYKIHDATATSPLASDRDRVIPSSPSSTADIPLEIRDAGGE